MYSPQASLRDGTFRKHKTWQLNVHLHSFLVFLRLLILWYVFMSTDGAKRQPPELLHRGTAPILKTHRHGWVICHWRNQSGWNFFQRCTVQYGVAKRARKNPHWVASTYDLYSRAESASAHSARASWEVTRVFTTWR